MCMPEADILTREVYVSKLELPNHVIDIPTLHRASDHEKLKASIPPGRAKKDNNCNTSQSPKTISILG